MSGQAAPTAIRENGGVALAGFAYDDPGRRTSLSRANGVTTTYVFNIALQRMTGMTDALGHTSSWTYDSSGRVLTATAPEGNSVHAHDRRRPPYVHRQLG